MDVMRTAVFERRVLEITDREAVIRIDVVAQRMRRGTFGDWKNVGHGVMETRIHYGAGYRVYWTRRGADVVLLLLCGDKRTQRRDIAQSIILSETLKLEC
jgi:putative addiction module killer protein